MKRGNTKSKDARALRGRAEKRLRGLSSPRTKPMSGADERALVHELQVHQIELEMQNEDLVKAQAVAREAADNYAELFDFAPVPYFVLDAGGVICDLNLAAAALLGRDRNRVTGQLFERYLQPDQRPEYAAFCDKLRAGGTKHTCELTLLKPNDDFCDVLVEATAVEERGVGGRGWRLAVMDITERRQAETALRQAQAELEKRVEERTAALAKLGFLLSAAPDPSAAARAVVDTALEYCGWDACFLVLHDPQTDLVTDLVNMDTIEERRVPVPPLSRGRRLSPLLRRVMEEGSQLILRQSEEEQGPLTRRFGDTSRVSLSLMFVPVRWENMSIGVLSVQSYQRNAYTPQDLATLQGLADHGAGALARLQAEVALRRVNEQLEARVAERTAQLQAASRYARSLVEASLDPMVTISAAGKITDANEATELVTGLHRERLIGSDFSAYFTEPDKAEEAYRRVLAEGLVRNYPLTARHVSGRTTEVLYNATVYRNEAGEVQGVCATARDMTEHRRAERRRDFTSALLALFAQKNSLPDYLAAVVEVIRQWSGCEALGIRVAGEHGELPYASCVGFEPAFLEMENQFSLQRDDCCCTRAVRQDFKKQERALVTPGGSFRCDDAVAFVSKLPQGTRAEIVGNCVRFGFSTIAAIPLRYRNEIIGVLHLADRRPGLLPPARAEFLESMSPLIGEAVRWYQTEAKLAEYRDHLEELVKQRTRELEAANEQLREEIACRKVAEEALLRTAEELKRSNLELEQFAYAASHDLQEPLRAAGGYVRLLEHRFPDKLDAKAREYIEGAAEGANRMEQLITDLLAFSRVGTQGRELVPVKLGAALDAALRNLQFSIRAAKATVTRDPLPTVPVDEGQMEQLFQNLIANALKFQNERPPELHIGARAEEGRWVIWVRDNGIGIAPQYFERIFQVFQRLHTRKKYPGTGIGLAICKKIVERHGGRIWVESQPGQGSTFCFSIPAGCGMVKQSA